MPSQYARGAKPREPTVTNVTMTNADTQYTHQLNQYTKKFIIHTRDESAFRLQFADGYVATPTEPYFTVLSNTRYWEDHIDTYIQDTDWDGTLYFASAADGKVIEIIEWR